MGNQLDYDAIATALLEGTQALIAKRIGPLEARIASLEADRGKGMNYCGVHQRAQDYRRGDGVTFKGGLWIATEDTSATPGDGPAWQLASKGG